MNKMIKMIMLLPVFFMGCKCVCEKPQPPRFSPLPPENFLRPCGQSPHEYFQDGQRMKELERELKKLKKKYNLPYVPLNIAYKSITKEDYIIKENCA